MLKQTGDHFIARLRAEISFAVNADADRVGFHVAVSDHEHGMHFHLLGVRDLGFHVIAAGVELGADSLGAQLTFTTVGDRTIVSVDAEGVDPVAPLQLASLEGITGITLQQLLSNNVDIAC